MKGRFLFQRKEKLSQLIMLTLFKCYYFNLLNYDFTNIWRNKILFTKNQLQISNAFLKEKGVYLHYDEADVEQDMSTMRRLEQEGQLKLYGCVAKTGGISIRFG